MKTRNTQEATGNFAEVIRSPRSNLNPFDGNSSEQRLVLCWHDAKVSIPNEFQPDTLRKVLEVIKEL